jgi:hypothetical protein
MKAFLFGAGSSCGTVGAPTSACFGRTLNEIDQNWQQNYPAVLAVVKHLGLPLEGWGLEEVWSCIDFTAKLCEAIPDAQAGPEVSPQLKKALLKVYGRRLDKKADCLPMSEGYTLGYLFANEVTDGDVLVSFNYDTVVERLYERFGRPLRTAGIAGPDSGVTLVKPHGSTSWTMDLTEKTLEWHTSWGCPLLDSLEPEDVDDGREPLVLGTVPIKSELIEQVQDCGGFDCIFDTVVRQWKAVVNAVRDADSLIVVGYSFPKEDHYGRFLIEEAFRLRKRMGKFAPTVEFYELPECRETWAAQVEGLMARVFGPNVSRPVFRGTVTRPSDT